MKAIILCIIILSGTIFGDIPYGTGSWDNTTLGNHRAVITVNTNGEAVAVTIPWRRRDNDPHKKNIIIRAEKSGQQVTNLFRLDVNGEQGKLIFQPIAGAGTYFVYYMPHIMSGRKNYPTVLYPEPTDSASPQWTSKYKDRFDSLPVASVEQFQAVDQFNSFYPMEVTALKSETSALTAKHREFLIFGESREFPIRMTNHLPLRWITAGAGKAFSGSAAKKEFYAFQVGVFAANTKMENVTVGFSELKGAKGVIPAAALRCINTGGVDWTGKRFQKQCSVEKGNVQALWCGIDVPEDVAAGLYEGTVSVGADGLKTQHMELRLKVKDDVLEDAGDGDPRLHSRLRWLDSTIALNDEVPAPFTPLEITKTAQGGQIACLGREVTIGALGLPVAVRSKFAPEVTHLLPAASKEILAAPMALKIVSADGALITLSSDAPVFTYRAAGAVEWKTAGQGGDFSVACLGRMECDGFVGYEVTVTAQKAAELKDIRLEIPYVKRTARYMMGLGVKGGFRKESYQWVWAVEKNQDGAWLGDVNAGMQFSLRDADYQRPLNTNFYHQKPLKMPRSWSNDGKGGIDINESTADTLLVKAYSGSRKMAAGEALHFNFTLLITPFKTIDTEKQWHHRFYHRFTPLKEIAARGANTVNVHHATEINPFINYPFMRSKEMKAYIDDAHQMDMKVKIYYTVRELSNIAPEIFALRSLGDEILSYGKGGGFAWLQEHLGDNYIAGWFVPQYKDAAVINSGVSRWHNYYLEGLNRLVREVGIDGIYIDDVAFDRTVMKRVRKILDTGGKGALIDLHSANQYNPRDGFANSANLYLEHFPYIDRLWFGEYFDYNSDPDFWLVEVSGIPFGLMGEMLQDGGNPWRGMVYGMTCRLPWAGDPSELWKAWDRFGMAESRMIGYWSENCPVKTDRDDVKATVYLHKGKKVLVALAGWGKEAAYVNLTIDWQALGLDPKRVKATAAAIKDFQEAALLDLGRKILVPKGRGVLISIE